MPDVKSEALKSKQRPILIGTETFKVTNRSPKDFLVAIAANRKDINGILKNRLKCGDPKELDRISSKIVNEVMKSEEITDEVVKDNICSSCGDPKIIDSLSSEKIKAIMQNIKNISMLTEGYHHAKDTQVVQINKRRKR